jgi:hypothetical protein
MSIREKINTEPRYGIAIAGLLLVVAIFFGHRYFQSGYSVHVPNSAFFSDDDGKTYFKDSIYKIAPWDHDGKTAVIARVYSYNDGQGTFIAYLERFPPASHKLLEDAYANAQASGGPLVTVTQLMAAEIRSGHTEVKLPGPGHEWLPRSQLPRSQIKSPDGSDFTLFLP